MTIMQEATLIYPHQLFSDHPALARDRRVYLFEDPLFFGDTAHPANFHALKRIFHRASMAAYAAELERRGHDVTTIPHAPSSALTPLTETLKRDGVEQLHCADPVDFLVEKRLRRQCEAHGVALHMTDGPGFLLPRDEVEARFPAEQKHYHQTAFYREERTRRDVLMDDGKPAGGRWTFDTQNRKALPADYHPPEVPSTRENEYVAAARASVRRDFPDAWGCDEPLPYPVTRQGARGWLSTFLDERLPDFGPYEDALSATHRVICHSQLSPLLNVGLLTPHEVLDAALARRGSVPLASLEGFVRQVMGWREFIRALYHVRGVAQRTTNHLRATRPLPRAFYAATTGLPPVDCCILRLKETAWLHHIERLMVLGNIMALLEIHPDDCYRWFMETHIDAYDWVMVPNVYGMSLHADGGLMVTKPYVSSSNYLRKMSDYARVWKDTPPQAWPEASRQAWRADWQAVWDALYWRFVAAHRELFRKNPRLAVMTSHLDRMDEATRQSHFGRAGAFLHSLG